MQSTHRIPSPALRACMGTSPAVASLVALMLARLESSYDRPAVRDALHDGRTWTWGEVIAAAVELATTFETMGVCRGHRLAHLGSHSPDWIVVDLACQLAGVVHVPLHADATAAEHAAQLAWLAPSLGIVNTSSCRFNLQRKWSVSADVCRLFRPCLRPCDSGLPREGANKAHVGTL